MTNFGSKRILEIKLLVHVYVVEFKGTSFRIAVIKFSSGLVDLRQAPLDLG